MQFTGFVFGIRFKNFSIQDNLGAIIDAILYNNNSLFNSEFFPEVRSIIDGKALINYENNNKLIINNENIIFEYNIKENFFEELDKYLSEYQNIIIDCIFDTFHIKNISRFGFVVRSKLPIDNGFVKNLIEITNSNEKELKGLTFTYNLVQKNPKILKNIKNNITLDYDNVIISYDRFSEEEEINFFTDYQKYFNPPLKNIKDSSKDFTSFCKNRINIFKVKHGIKETK